MRRRRNTRREPVVRGRSAPLAHPSAETQRMDESLSQQKTIFEAYFEGYAEGRMEVARRILLRLATRRYGPPDASLKAVVEAIKDIGRLRRLIDRIDDVGSWPELLAVS